MFKISHNFNCNSKCLIYYFLLRYVRNNILDLLLISLGINKTIVRTTNIKQKEDYIQEYLHDHFLTENHLGLLNNVEITFIDKTDPSDPERREEF